MLTGELHRLQSLARENVGQVYDALETLCVCFPGRVTGSETLERSLDYLLECGKQCLPCRQCKEEIVANVPRWIRSPHGQEETCTITIGVKPGQFPIPHPLKRHLRVLATGLSSGTTTAGVSGALVIVRDFEELQILGEQGLISNKIVLYDYGTFVKYEYVAKYRALGAIQAAQYGAVAVLVRSLTPNDSCSGLHTGTQLQSNTIPSATLSIEDTELLSRLHRKGYELYVDRLFLPCVLTMDPSITSRNLLFELPGSSHPEEIVLIGAHTDCWDCAHQSCQGAHDDAQGVIVCLYILKLLHAHGFVPQRTIRAVLFVDEEIAQRGAQAYQEAHAEEAERLIAAIETDMGAGPIAGFGFSGSEQGRERLTALLTKISDLLQPQSLSSTETPLAERWSLRVDPQWSGKGVDISPLVELNGVPGLLLRHTDRWWYQEYFHMHHSHSDTIDHVDQNLLLENFTVLLCTVWTLANTNIYLR